MSRVPEVDRRITQCVDWATKAIITFADGHRVWDEAPREPIQPFDKMVIESSLMALIAQRVIPGDASVIRLLDAIESCALTLDRMYDLVRQRPYLWTSVGSVWLILDKFNRGDAVKRERLRALWNDTSTLHPCERVPYRLLDQAWTRSLARGGDDPQLTSDGLRLATSFENLDGALLMETSDLYAVTHTVMYLTDFGRTKRVENRKGNARRWIDSLSASRLLINDLDLAGELTMSSLMLGNEMGAGDLVTLSTLSSIIDSLGFVPSPTFRAADYETSDVPDSYAYFHSYHTTLVYGLLCAVLASDDDPNPLAVRAVGPSAESTLPSEWCGRRAGAGALSDQIIHTLSEWSGICEERDVAVPETALLRSVLDAYLVRACNEFRADEVASLLGMTSLVSPSHVDEAARRLLDEWRSLSPDVTLIRR
jgi:uncharacterized protein DUF6895